VTFGSVQVCAYVRQIYTSKPSPVARERMLHRSGHIHAGQRRLFSMPFSVFGPDPIPYDSRHLMDDILGESSVRCKRKRTLLHSKNDSWKIMLSMMREAQKEKICLENKMRNLHLSTLSSCKTVTTTPCETIAGLTEFRVQKPFPFKPKRRETQEAHPRRGVFDAVECRPIDGCIESSSLSLDRNIFIL